MSGMNEQVIEAAARELERFAESQEDGKYNDPERWSQEAAESAIRAADSARAEQGFVLVKRDDLRFVLDEFGWREFRFGTAGIEEVHKRLTAALGDGEHITETE